MSTQLTSSQRHRRRNLLLGVVAIAVVGGAAWLSFGPRISAAVRLASLPSNRATVDRLWNRFVAAWFEGGKDDPKLQLIRLDPTDAQIWLNANSLFAGIKLMLGSDPKKDYKDKVADVRL